MRRALPLLLLAGCRAGLPDEQSQVTPWAGELRTNEDEPCGAALYAGVADPPATTVARGPSHGIAAVRDGTVWYTPEPDWSGDDAFTLSVEGAGEVPWSVVVAPVNDAPVATSPVVSTAFEKAVTVGLEAVDVDGDPLTFALSILPTHGDVSLAGDQLTYTPEAGWSGRDTVGFVVRDGVATATGEVTVDVDAPGVSVADLRLTTDEDTPVTTPLTAVVRDGGTVTGWAIVSAPGAGVASVDGAMLTYTPFPDAYGGDVLLVQATDSTGALSTPSAVRIDVLPVNDVPVVADLAVDAVEDTPASFVLPAEDVDGDSLVAVVTQAPTQGDVSVDGRVATWTPPPDFTGTVTFAWRASDGSGGESDEALVVIDVAPVDDAPTADAVSGAGDEDTTLVVTLTGADVEDGGVTAFMVTGAPTHGVATLDGATLTYTPDADWNGSDEVAVVATDVDGLASTPAVVALLVAPVQDPPVPDTLTLSGDENGGPVSVTLTAADVDGDPLTYALVSNGAHGHARVAGTTLTYTPDADWDGVDAVVWAVSDGIDTVASTLDVSIADTNGSPRAADLALTTDEEVAVSGDLPASDPDGGPLTARLTSRPTHGDVSLDGLTLTYTPDPDFAGRDSLRYEVTDADGWTGSATVTVDVANVEDAPTLVGGTLTTDEDTPVAAPAPADDPDTDDVLVYAFAVEPAHGTVSVDADGLVYTPDPEWSGADTFELVVDDGTVTTAPSRWDVSVAPVRDVPTVAVPRLHTAFDTALDWSPVAVAPDSAAVTVAVTTPPRHGSMTETSGVYHYVPDAGWMGRDHLWLAASDELGDGEPVEVQISVHRPALAERAPLLQLGLTLILYTDASLAPEDVAEDRVQFLPDAVLAQLHGLGAQYQRQTTEQDLGWEVMEPDEGVWLDPALNVVYDDPTLEVVGTLFDMEYASPNSPYCTDATTFQKTLGPDAEEYLDHVIDGFGDRMGFVELGNELWHWVAADPPAAHPEDLPDCYPADGFSPEEQGRFLQEAADYVHAGAPDAKVVLSALGSASPVSEEWLRGVVAGSTDTDWIDVTSWHNYSPWQDADDAGAENEALLEELGLEDKLYAVFEMGSSNNPAYPYLTDYPNSVETQCSDVFRLPLLAWGNGGASASWHTLMPLSSDPPLTNGTFAGYELLDFDGTWRPAAYTYRLLATEIVPFAALDRLPVQGRWWYRVLRSDGAVRWVGWGEGPVTVPEGVHEATLVVPEADGSFVWSAVSPGDRLVLGDVPVLLR